MTTRARHRRGRWAARSRTRGSRSTAATRADSSAKARAIAAPMPPRTPKTATTCRRGPIPSSAPEDCATPLTWRAGGPPAGCLGRCRPSDPASRPRHSWPAHSRGPLGLAPRPVPLDVARPALPEDFPLPLRFPLPDRAVGPAGWIHSTAVTPHRPLFRREGIGHLESSESCHVMNS